MTIGLGSQWSRLWVLAVLGASGLPGTDVAAQAARAASTATRAVEIAPADRHPYAPGVDVQHYDVALTLDGRSSDVRATATLQVRRALSVDTLRLDLLHLTVDTVLVQGRPRSFVRDSTQVHIPLRAADGTMVRVTVRYHGAPADGLIIRNDSTRGWSAFGDNWPNRARHWLPSVDHPSDKATVNWTVTAPAGLSVVANGVRVERRLHAERPGQAPLATTRYRLQQPIPTYLMVVGVATLQQHTLGKTACGAAISGGCVPQSVWTFPQEAPSMPGHFAEAGRIVSTFARLLGPFVYPHLAHVQSATRFGGMENATAIFYSDQAFRTRGVGVSLIAHETAHQWFGDAVTPRRWADLWLSEGFATYLAAVYTQRTRGDSAFRAELRAMRETIINAPVVASRPVVDSVGGEEPLTLLNANSYQKGGFVLHMLRETIGDVAFFGALRDYQRLYRHGTATTNDFRVLAEKRSRRSLTAFFQQWLHRPGWAELTVSWVWRAESQTLALQVEQGRGSPYAMPLRLRLRTADGRDIDVRTEVAAQASQLLIVPVKAAGDITELTVDPHADVLARVQLMRAMP